MFPLKHCARLQTRPFSRSEAILDGLFTDGTTLCESDGDRIVYESTLQTLPPPQPDVRFIPVGGIGGFKEPVRLYRALQVPVTIAADFDFLVKAELPQVLKELGAADNIISGLSSRIDGFVKKVSAVKSELSVDAAVAELKSLLSDAGNWENLQKQSALRSKLNRLLGRLNRLALLKLNGMDGVPDDLKVVGRTR